jgi:hypothetical protein
VEDLKERYYSIAEKLERVHGGATASDQVRTTIVGSSSQESVVPQPRNVVRQPRNVVPQLRNVVPQLKNVVPQPRNVVPQPRNVFPQPGVVAPRPLSVFKI